MFRIEGPLACNIEVRNIPIIELTGMIEEIDSSVLEGLEVFFDFPNDTFIKVLHTIYTEEIEGMLSLALLRPDGTVDCVILDFDNQWEALGRMYGYPECCIHDFIKLGHEELGYYRNFTGTGYVPCQVCDDKPMNEVVKVICENRFVDHPFMLEVRDLDEQIAKLQVLAKLIEN